MSQDSASLTRLDRSAKQAVISAGVDLALDKFDLSAPERFANSLPACSGVAQKG